MAPEDEDALLRAENAALRAQVSELPLASSALGANVGLACWLAIPGDTRKMAPRRQAKRLYAARGASSITGMLRDVFS